MSSFVSTEAVEHEKRRPAFSRMESVGLVHDSGKLQSVGLERDVFLHRHWLLCFALSSMGVLSAKRFSKMSLAFFFTWVPSARASSTASATPYHVRVI
jgi:hypothetical protein